jgi:hypothetical protein
MRHLQAAKGLPWLRLKDTLQVSFFFLLILPNTISTPTVLRATDLFSALRLISPTTYLNKFQNSAESIAVKKLIRERGCNLKDIVLVCGCEGNSHLVVRWSEAI